MDNTIIEKHGEYEHILTLRAPFDKRNSIPSKDYGIHGMELRMVVRRSNNCTQFVAYLPVYLPHVTKELWGKPYSEYNPFEGMGADVGYHASSPQYEDQTPMDYCDLLKGGRCYYDGSGLRADEWYKIFLEKGLNEIWKMLETDWEERFGIMTDEGD